MADPGTTEAMIGIVDAEWRRRIDDVVSCPDNVHIPRVPGAGTVRRGFVMMHNGIEVSSMGYYGSGVLNMLIENRGVHEPQEERAFAEVLRVVPPGSTMIELGAYWAFYSLWFAKTVEQAKCYLVEPNASNLLSGRINFRRAGAHGVFERAYIGRTEGIAPDGTRIVGVDPFCDKKRIRHVAILHADVQEAEADMLDGAKRMLSAGAIDYIFISTHTNALHYECIDRLQAHSYRLLASADCDQTYSDDGLIVAKSPRVALPETVTISLKPQRAPAGTL